MMTLLAMAGAMASATLVFLWGRTFLALSGDRVIVCPETHEPAGVTLERFRGALRALAGYEPLRVAGCSRWPERAGCAQECLREIRAAPDAASCAPGSRSGTRDGSARAARSM